LAIPPFVSLTNIQDDPPLSRTKGNSQGYAMSGRSFFRQAIETRAHKHLSVHVRTVQQTNWCKTSRKS
jgi:hypothetical protein